MAAAPHLAGEGGLVIQRFGRALLLCVVAAVFAAAIAWLVSRADREPASVAPVGAALSTDAETPRATAAELAPPSASEVDRSEVVPSSAPVDGEVDAPPVRPARIRGLVVGPTGQPWPQANVRADVRGATPRPTGTPGFSMPGVSEQSDGDGAFVLTVEPGTMRIQASAPGTAPSAVIEREVAPGEELE